MTPREPDRFDTEARAVLREADASAAQVMWLLPYVAAALRAEHASALERALAEVPNTQPDTRDRIRALIPPAAAPAADYDPITAPIPAGDMNGPHGPLPAAETGKGQGAEALPDPWALLDQARDWLDFMVKHPGDGVPHNLIARIDAALKRDARAAPPEREGK